MLTFRRLAAEGALSSGSVKEPSEKKEPSEEKEEVMS